MIFNLTKYPFLSESKQVLGELALTIERIDQTNVFDSIIKDALIDITKSFVGNRIITSKVSPDMKYEVGKFYTTLYILRSNPTKLMTRYWLTAYMNKLKSILIEDIRKRNMKFISDFLNELGMKHKFVRVEDEDWMIIKINNYLDFSLEIQKNDPEEYQLLLLVNMPLDRGMVFIPVNEKLVFYYMILKLCEKRIKEMINSTDKIIRSEKIDKSVDQLQKYLVDIANMPNGKPIKKELEYGEATPQMQFEHEQILKELFTDKAVTKLDVKQFPPCINAILNKLNSKQNPLGHRENILLGTYLASRGFTKEQMIEIFKMALNYDKNTTEYNVEYLLERKIKPFNCNNCETFHLCFADESCKRLKLTNPMNYRRLEK